VEGIDTEAEDAPQDILRNLNLDDNNHLSKFWDRNGGIDALSPHSDAIWTKNKVTIPKDLTIAFHSLLWYKCCISSTIMI
jgi:hypothetical protein